MAKPTDAEQRRRGHREVREALPPGVKLLRTLRGHKGRIGRIAWSPDGRMLASPSSDGRIRLWDAETGECVRRIESGQRALYSVAFDPSGRMLACNGNSGISVRLLTTGDQHREFTSGLGFDVAWSPDGRTLIIPSGDRSDRFADAVVVETKELAKRIELTDNLNCAIWSSRDGMLALADDAGTVHILSRDLENIRSFKPGRLAHCIARSPDGTILASAGSALEAISVSEFASGKLIATLEAHTGAIVSLSFSHDGLLLASKSDDHSVRVWRVSDFQSVAVIEETAAGGPRPFRGLAFAPNNMRLAVTGEGDSVIHLYELDLAVLLGQSAAQSVTYTTAKIVLVGDSGVGKTGLGWRWRTASLRSIPRHTASSSGC